ncbi:MAG: DegT/DnrJ/EryC1/StrS family aminotransferase [Desulfobacterales bacterium]
MKFVDLQIQQNRIRNKLQENIQNVLDHGQYVMGPEIAELEDQFGQFSGVNHAVACSSGTDALLMSLMAYGVGPGDAVFTTPFTFFATAEVISLLGAVPVFVDIDPYTFNISPAELERAILAMENADQSIYPIPENAQASSLSPKGVIAVDLFGLPAEYDQINSIAEKHGLFVIEDAAQSFGAAYKGKKSCSLAEIACTSFFPAKPLGCYGDGGMCFTDSDELAGRIRSFRIHGQGDHPYDNVRIGINGRMDTLQAAVLLAKFEIFHEEIDLRQRVADRYNELLSDCPFFVKQQIPEYCRSIWAQYSLLSKDSDTRSAILQKMKDENIPYAIYYPKPLHLQTAFAFLGYGNGSFPVSEDYSQRILSLPMHPYLDEESQRRITRILTDKK